MSSKGASKRKLVNSEPDTPESPPPAKRSERNEAMEIYNVIEDKFIGNSNGPLPPWLWVAPKASKVMHNPLVLELIAKNLPGSDLQNLRSTSKLWNRTFIPQLQSKHSVIKLESPKGLEDFTSLSRPAFPFTKYEITGLGLPPQRISEDFFTIYGHSINHLSLAFGKRLEISKIREIFSLAPNLTEFKLATDFRRRPIMEQQLDPMPEIPNLRRVGLIITNIACNFDPGEEEDFPSRNLHREWKKFLADLLKGATALESFSIKNLYMEWHNCNVGAAEAIRDSVVHRKKLKSVEMLDLEVPELRLLLEVASRDQNPLRLQEFCTSFWDPGEEDQVIQLLYAFLDSQSPSMQHLSIDLIKLSPRPIRIPWMEKLEKYTIFCHVHPVQYEYDGGTLADNFPSLKQLDYKARHIYEKTPSYFSYSTKARTIGIRESDPSWLNFRPQIIHDGVTDLVLTSGSTTLAKIGPSLPLVTRLEIDLASSSLDCFPLLWTTWPALQSLYVRFSKDLPKRPPLQLDELLSGIPKSKFNGLRREMRMVMEPVTLELISQLLQKYKTNPGISDLKHLQNFTLQIQGNDCVFLLTNFAGYFGFAMASSRIQNLAFLVDSPGRRPPVGAGAGNLLSQKCRGMIKSAVHPFAVINI